MIPNTLEPFHYQVYGLNLETEWVIPGLLPTSSTCDPTLKVHFHLIPKWVRTTRAPWAVIYSSEDSDDSSKPSLIVKKHSETDYYLLTYDDGTLFLLNEDGSAIWCTWSKELTLEDASIYLLGPVLGFALRLKGITCLHASAFVFRNSVVALAGEAGSGKSTTAAALAQRGFPVLSDDVVALLDKGGTIWVEPAYPRLRLWPDSVHALFGSEDALSRLTPNWDKRYLDLTQLKYHFSTTSLPLSAIYLISDRTDDLNAPFVEAIPTKQALLALIANSYASCLLDSAMRAREFKCLSRLLESIPIRRIRPHTDPAYLPSLCDVILEDLEANISRPAVDSHV